MLSSFHPFFSASASASAAFIGLLFVALSFIESEDGDRATAVRQRLMANNSFSQLVDIFFISLMALTPDARNLPIVGLVLAVLGLLATFRLTRLAFKSHQSVRRPPYGLGIVAVAAYILQLVVSIKLLHQPNNSHLLQLLVLAIIILYIGALLRAWELTGIRQRRSK